MPLIGNGLPAMLPRFWYHLRKGREGIVHPAPGLRYKTAVYDAADVVFALVIEPCKFLRRRVEVASLDHRADQRRHLVSREAVALHLELDEIKKLAKNFLLDVPFCGFFFVEIAIIRLSS